LLTQAAYAKGNLFATYRPNTNWEFTAFIKNIGNTTTKTSALAANTFVGNPILGSLAPPRLFGATIQYKF
jgi:iron complex outermembrane receptor protein